MTPSGYGAEITADYVEAVYGGPGWQTVFERYGIDWVLLTPGASLTQILMENDDWTETIRDETGVIFVPAQ